jgi:hypothetical protein
MTKKSKRPKGQAVPTELRARGLAMVRAKARTVDIMRTLSVSGTTVRRWRHVVRKGGEAIATHVPPPTEAPAALRVTPVSYLADSLATIAQLLRERLPNAVKFSVTTAEANIEYTLKPRTNEK